MSDVRFDLELSPLLRLRLIQSLEGLVDVGIGKFGGGNAISDFLTEVRLHSKFEMSKEKFQVVYFAMDLHGINLNGTVEPLKGLDHEALRMVSEMMHKQVV